MRIFALAFSLLIATVSIMAQDIVEGTEAQLSSPDGKYKVSFCQRSQDGANRMYYSVSFDGEKIIGESELGVDIDNRLFESALGIPNDSCKNWGDNLKVIGMEKASRDTLWTPIYGEDNLISDRYNALTIKLCKGDDNGVANDNGYNKRRFYYMNVELRAYNEGVALRYHFPEATNGLFIHLTGDRTSFALPVAATAWHERWAQAPHKKIQLDQWHGESERPLLLRLPSSTYVAIGEARLTDFTRGKIDAINDSTLKMKLYESADIITPYDTPWRVVMAGKRAVDLINHKQIFLNLNDPCAIANTDFIRCGKVFRIGKLQRDAIYKGIDFAAERGFQFVELDAGWYGSEAKIASMATKVADTRDFDIADICAKAKAKGLGLYTLCYFNKRVKNTKAHQLAMAVVYYSPMQFMMWYDSPSDYKGEREMKFWADVPTVWDESVALDGEPGEYIVQARRSGGDWYLGAMTNTSARKITIDTSRFLERGKAYSVEIYSDDPSLGTRTNVASTSIGKFKAGKSLVFNLQKSGGVAIRFVRL